MKAFTWEEGMTDAESKDGAYWERNMLALQLAVMMNDVFDPLVNAVCADGHHVCGWYFDTDNNWDGWHRVISINEGRMTFHIPDDFDIGRLPQIEPNWDGHTTEKKWIDCMENCGCATAQ